MNKLDRIIELLESIDKKLTTSNVRKQATKRKDSEEISTWSIYCDSFKNRYTFEPVRNSMMNSMLAGVKKRVPESDLKELIEFFVSQNDQWYLREMHHPRCLLKDCEMLMTRMKTKIVMTSSKARMMEQASQNADESKKFIMAKYGGKNANEP